MASQPILAAQAALLSHWAEAEEYRYTVIAGPNRDWLWIMARDTQLPDEDWKEIETLVGTKRFDFDGFVAYLIAGQQPRQTRDAELDLVQVGMPLISNAPPADTILDKE